MSTFHTCNFLVLCVVPVCVVHTHDSYIIHTYMTYKHTYTRYVCMCSTGTVCLWNVVRYRRSSSKLTYIHTYVHVCTHSTHTCMYVYTFMSKDKKARLYLSRVVFCIEVYSLVGCHVGRSVSYVCTFVCVCVADLVSIASCYDGNCTLTCGHTVWPHT